MSDKTSLRDAGCDEIPPDALVFGMLALGAVFALILGGFLP